jgi:NDP-sugar pyrophosphorylase family protein
MRAMILAAGVGHRMKPLTDRLPKPLLPVAGYPLIAYALGLLRSAGISEIVVNTFHLADILEETLSRCASDTGTQIVFSRETTLLETGGGLANARKLLGTEPFVVLNADVICDLDLRSVIDDHLKSDSLATMVLRVNPDPANIPIVEWDTVSRAVVDIRSDMSVTTSHSIHTMFTGIQVFNPDVFDYLTVKPESSISAFYLPALREGRRIQGRLHDGYWRDVGTPESYTEVNDSFEISQLRHFQPVAISTNKSNTGSAV